MKLRTVVVASVLAASSAPAMAAPWMALDGSPQILLMIDRGSIARYGAIRVAQTLYVIKEHQPVVFSIRYNCDLQTFGELDQRLVSRSMTLGSPVAGSQGMKSAPPGSLGAAAMANVCQDKVVNTSAGWTRPDLKSAVDAAIAAGYAPVWP